MRFRTEAALGAAIRGLAFEQAAREVLQHEQVVARLALRAMQVGNDQGHETAHRRALAQLAAQEFNRDRLAARRREQFCQRDHRRDPMRAIDVIEQEFLGAIHLTELRSKIDEARSRLNLGLPPYTDSITPGSTAVRAIHFEELRDGVR